MAAMLTLALTAAAFANDATVWTLAIIAALVGAGKVIAQINLLIGQVKQLTDAHALNVQTINGLQSAVQKLFHLTPAPSQATVNVTNQPVTESPIIPTPQSVIAANNRAESEAQAQAHSVEPVKSGGSPE